jgi:ribosome-binding protein aMBF1 (putative translation factor)
MATKTLAPSTSARRLMDQWGEPFARALAESVCAVEEKRRKTPGTPAGRAAWVPVDSAELPAPVRRRIAASLARGRKAGEAAADFAPADLAAPLSQRIRAVARAQGVSQSELARRLKVTPAVISRVFQHPERAKLQTLRRIAQALDVPVDRLI